MKTIIVLLALLSLAIAQQRPVIFSSAYSLNGNYYWFVGQTEISSGITNELVNTFYSIDSAAGYLGISAFDTDKGVYYYVSDGSSGALGIRADVLRSTIKAPIGFQMDWVNQLNYDPIKKRVLGKLVPKVDVINSRDGIIAGSGRGVPALISVPTDESIKSSSAVITFDFIGKFRLSALDSANQQYYFITMQQVNNSYVDFLIYQLDLNNPGRGAGPTKLNCQRTVFPSKLVWDSQQQQLIMFGIEPDVPTINYYTHYISITGACVQKKLAIPGPDALFTYDQYTGLGYAVMAPGGINTLYTFNASSGAIEDKVVLGSTAKIQSIELAYV